MLDWNFFNIQKYCWFSLTFPQLWFDEGGGAKNWVKTFIFGPKAHFWIKKGQNWPFLTVSAKMGFFRSPWNFSAGFWAKRVWISPWYPLGCLYTNFQHPGCRPAHFLRGGLRGPPMGIFHFKRLWGIGLRASKRGGEGRGLLMGLGGGGSGG